MTEGMLNRIAQRVLPTVLGLLSRLWFATCRVRVHGWENFTSTYHGGTPLIATFWHYSLLVVFLQMRKYSGVAMVSSSRDGEYIARLAHHFKFSTVRGSSNRKGVQALKDLIKATRSGKNTAMVADGSQGPALVAQPGSILLASRTGVPIVPMAWSASRYLAIRSWDRTAFPKPFSKVDFIVGEPLMVPPGIKGDGIEEYRLLLEQRLTRLYTQAWRLHGRTEH